MKSKITEYNFPDDLKNMDSDELDLLAWQIREFLIESVSRTGGHLASNLGAVELTIALHKVFNSPKDRIIWDVGHQSYVHKILTGRAEGFSSLRQTGGLSGFPKRRESEHDVYETGHSSTSISAASGMAHARDILGQSGEVIAVIGDGSLTGGMAYEALNNIGSSDSKVIIVINDNGMSISKNIGGVSRHLNKLRTSHRYAGAKREIKNRLDKMPIVGHDIARAMAGSKDIIKYMMIGGGILFEEFGFTYLGPIDGHDIKKLMDTLEQAKNSEESVVVHIITKKGKGYLNAEKDPDKFHGIGPFDKETGKEKSAKTRSYSDVLGETMLEIAEERNDVAAISAAMGDAVGLSEFRRKHPDRFFDVGIAEQHAVGMAAGLASCGIRPLVAIYDSFLQRAYDQIVEDVCLQDLPVIFAIDRAGAVGQDGETHHGMYDLSYLRSIPNMMILTPASGEQMKDMLKYAFYVDGPVAIRYPRGCVLTDPEVKMLLSKGKGSNLHEGISNLRIASGCDIDIWAVGTMLETAVKVRKILLEKSVDAGIVDVRTVKPMDLSCLNADATNLVSLEDGALAGGFGEALAAAVPDGYRVQRFGWPDIFIEHGAPNDLREKYRLDAESIAERILEEIERKA